MKRLHLPAALKSRKALMIAPVILIVVVVAILFSVRTIAQPGNGGPEAKKPTDNAFTAAAKAQVDNVNGSPVSGRDPANQAQNSLAKAASTPSGTGTRTDKPAAGAQGSTGNKVSPNQVYSPEQQKSGINTAGCFYDYGIPGEECMPAGMAKADGTLDCKGVHMHFPNGIKVSGTDRFHLDRNHDGMACAKGD